MEQQATKMVGIRVKCGHHEKEVAFPVTEEMAEWIKGVKMPAEEGDGPRFEAEGSRNVRVSISLYDLQRRF